MKVSYIGHSGFAVELAGCTLLFDYYQGVFPPFALDKPLYVFASHAHQDHFNFAIFELGKAHPNVTYILSRDIKRKWSAAGFARHGVPKKPMMRWSFWARTKRSGLARFAWKRSPLQTRALRSLFLHAEKPFSMREI